MYKCKECGCEYEVKPDYCDCGNDEFEEIIVNKTDAIPGKTPEEPVIIPAKKIVSAKDFKTEKISQNRRPKKTFSEQYPEFSRFISSVDPVSGIIFFTCLVLSILVILFAWNVDDNAVIKELNETKETKVVKNIPAIDSFWNNALPKAEVKIEQKEKEIKEENIIKKITAPIAVQKPVQTTVKLQKNTQTNQKTTAKTTTKQIKKQTVKPQTAKTTTNTEKPKTTQQTAAKTTQTIATSQKSAAEIAAEEAAKKAVAAQKAAAAKQEFANYKVGLRNTIGRKIDFTRVVGDGSCTVSFKINSNGKLVSRSFAKQSSNITLNDAVYAAVMSTPTYNPPPAGYNNEILNLNIKFYNGNFEITLN